MFSAVRQSHMAFLTLNQGFQLIWSCKITFVVSLYSDGKTLDLHVNPLVLKDDYSQYVVWC